MLRLAPILALFACLSGCASDEDSDRIVWDGAKGEELPSGVAAVFVTVTEDIPFDAEVATAHQTYVWDERSALFVETQAIVLPSEAMLAERAQLTGRAHLRVEPFLDDPLLSPGQDMVFELQFGSREKGWRAMLPPAGYRWRSIASVRLDPLGPFLIVVGEACRYEELSPGQPPARRCDFARRWEKVSGAGIRLVPFPAWPLAVLEKAEGQISYGSSLVDAEDASQGSDGF